jgi:hypothetical protein
MQYIFLFLPCKLQAQTTIITGQMADENKLHKLGGFTNCVMTAETGLYFIVGKLIYLFATMSQLEAPASLLYNWSWEVSPHSSTVRA